MIVKHGSFKSAAEHLHKSQPSISAAIKKLEEEFGFKIFSRDEYRPVLTKNGQKFHQQVVNCLSEFNQLTNLGQELGAGLESEINISIDAICPLEKIKTVLQTFQDPIIKTSLNLSVEVIDGSIEKVLSGEVDLAITSYLGQGEDIESIPILETQMVPVIHPEIFKSLDGLEKLQRIPQIILKSSAKNPSKTTHGILPNAKYWYTTDIASKYELIKNGLGWGRLPCFLITDNLNNQSLVEIKNILGVEKVNIPLYLIRYKQKPMGPNTKRIWDYLKKIVP
jgi:DNA-binding transcriptional LysR family regulator